MRTVSIRLEDLAKMAIKIGFVGENEHTRVCIDCKKAFEEYPNAAAALTVQPPAGEAYPDVTTRDGDTVIWDVMDHDLTDEGNGELQLSFVVDETVKKSYIGRTEICRSILPAGDVPEAIDDWLTRANAALAEIPIEIAEALEEAKESGEFDGRGIDDAVMNSDYTLTLTFTDGTSYTTPSIKGDKGDKGDTGAKGDKGDKGDTGETGPQGNPPTAEQIQTAANTYLAQVITNPDSPPLDRSLTSSSAATPADITGELKSAIDSIFPEAAKTALLHLLKKVAYIDSDGEDYYTALENLLTLKTLSSISVVFDEPNKDFALCNTTLDDFKPYLTVTATYTDQTTETIPISNCTLSGTLVYGDNTVTVTYENKTATFTAKITTLYCLLDASETTISGNGLSSVVSVSDGIISVEGNYNAYIYIREDGTIETNAYTQNEWFSVSAGQSILFEAYDITWQTSAGSNQTMEPKWATTDGSFNAMSIPINMASGSSGSDGYAKYENNSYGASRSFGGLNVHWKNAPSGGGSISFRIRMTVDGVRYF